MTLIRMILFVVAMAVLPSAVHPLRPTGVQTDGPASETMKPRLYVLSVGVSTHLDASLNLTFADKDARDLAEAFRQQTQLYDVRQVQVLTNAQASRQAIRQALSDMRIRVNAADLFVFIFSGHGLEDKLVPYDFSRHDPFSTSLLKEDLKRLLDQLGCNYVILVDACHSGSMAKGLSKDIQLDEVNSYSRRLLEGLQAHDKTHMIVGSSASNQLSFECPECRNGYFATVVKEAFANQGLRDSDGRMVKPDQNGDGIVTLYEFSEFMQDGVRIRTSEAKRRNPGIDIQKVYAKVQTSANLPFIRVSETGPALPVEPTRREDPPSPTRDPDPIQQLIDNMVYVQGGAFTMGCTPEQGSDCEEDEKPSHLVRVSDFHIGRYEVTQLQWRTVMGGDPTELYNIGCGQCPVEGVSWEDVQAFIQRLNSQTGMTFRLPTEAEWEYAARGGNKNRGYKYSGSNNINDVAWYKENAQQGNTHGNQKTTRPVGGKNPNELGLYDMSGNVWEWCSDWFKGYPGSSGVYDYTGSYRVYRGGGWFNYPRFCRVSIRNGFAPTYRSNSLGFRLVRQF